LKVPDSPVRELMRAADAGDAIKTGELFAALYRELHAIAERELNRGGRDLTLSPATLLHEAYLALADRDVGFPDRARFLAYASRVMRGLLIDYVRRRRAVKRGGQFRLTTLSEDEAGAGLPATEPLERLSLALDALEAMDPRLANVVDLHFFCGFPLVDIARLRGVTDRTVQSDWRKARLLLQHEMDRADPLSRSAGRPVE
jgi:RNA polymerase sigma factor (TIGR02999 family)